MQCAVCPYRTVHQLSFGDDQFLLLWRKEELRYHPKGTDEIDKTQPIDDSLALPYREPFTPMTEPKVKSQIMVSEQIVYFSCHSLIVYRSVYPCSP